MSKVQMQNLIMQTLTNLTGHVTVFLHEVISQLTKVFILIWQQSVEAGSNVPQSYISIYK